ncbi:hypothetical protein AAVH_13423 [Aphelenchoides avenae]|nr:hypothetical protein AAVH_13423 [Aphelenchus avenae]
MKIHVIDVPAQRCLIHTEEAVKCLWPGVPVAVQGNFWKAFLHYATITQLVVLAALIAVYEEWRQMGPITVAMVIIYVALSLVGVALLKTFRGHYPKADTALLYLPLASAEWHKALPLQHA